MMRLPLCRHRFLLQGLNTERFLNIMQQEGIPLTDVRRLDTRSLVCCCPTADLRAVEAIAQQKGWRMQVLKPLGLSAFAVRIRNRPGIPIGICLALVLVLIASRFVWRVELYGAGTYEADIYSYLMQSGYRAGIMKSKVDAKALEASLLARYPKIAWFQAYVVNSTLVVEVTHGVPMPEQTDTAYGHVYASEDGIVQSVRVYAGTAAVKIGDVVRKGELLIRGEERSSDGTVVPVRADGTVLARCWQSFKVNVPVYDIISTETGRKTTSLRLCTPWFCYPSSPVEADYLASNLYITQQPVGGAFFPVWLETRTSCEASMERILRNMEDVRAEATEAAFKKLKTALFDHDIIDKWVDYCMIEDDTLALTVTAEKLVDIGVFCAP